MATTVEVMVRAFREAGTPLLVGHPGGESVELLEAARQQGVRFLFAKQESAGAMIAATWGDLTGAPGVCLSTRAPGAANMVNGVAQAWMDRSPLIAITDQYPAHVFETSLRQRLDQLALYRPIVKWNGTLGARTVGQQLARAIRTATAHPPGPVQLDLPADQTTREAVELEAPPRADRWEPRPEGGSRRGDGPERGGRRGDGPEEGGRWAGGPEAGGRWAGGLELRPEAGSLGPALAMLAGARRPIVLAGMGVLWDRAQDELRALVEQLGAPLLTTTKAKGVLPEDHPLAAGALIGGLIEREIVGRADLIVAVGLDTIELQPKPWPYTAPVLALASTTSLDAVVPASLELVGALGPLAAALASSAPAGSGWGEAAARAYRSELSDALDRPGKGLTPHRLVEVARAALPRETVATVDSGAHRLLVVQKWPAYAPRGLLSSNGLATMGYAIPAALGARLVHPERPVVAFTGDGGFLMALAELQTAVQERLPIVVVVFDDREIGQIRVKQEIKGLPRHGIALGGVDYEKLAAGLGADGVVMDSEAGLGDALGAAARSGRVTVVAARIDPSTYVEQFNALREL